MIEVDHLSKDYGRYQAVADLSFAVESGEILGFLGPNGAGKTTTMRILTGYLPATSGTARVAGFDVHENSMAVRQSIGYLPETPPLYPEMSVEGYLNFVAQLKGVAAGDRPKRIDSALKRCALEDRRRSLITTLSKGYRQRVGIAQAIVHDPPVIILDEPTVGLDPRQIIEVRELIKSLAGQHTIILSTHILPEVSMTCDRVAIIDRGRLVTTNSPDSLMAELVGGDRYAVEIEGSLEQAQAALHTVAGVQSIVPQPRSGLAQGHLCLTIVTDGPTDLGRDLSAALIHGGLGLYEMKRSRASLEDVFLSLTTEDRPSDAAEAGAGPGVELDGEAPASREEPASSVKPVPSVESVPSDPPVQEPLPADPLPPESAPPESVLESEAPE
jgi:ABC-2 type transport system ATP-binding protein